MAGVSHPKRLAETVDAASGAHHKLPWAIALRSGNVWAAPAICFCWIDTYVFFASWFHTCLVKTRGFSEKDLWLSSLPYAVAVACNLPLAVSDLIKMLRLLRSSGGWCRDNGLKLSGIRLLRIVGPERPAHHQALRSKERSGTLSGIERCIAFK
jgi:hypothetical protein